MQLTLKLPCTKEGIKEETEKLRQEISVRSAEINMLRQAIKHYQGQCTHPGQVTGMNERDGSWGNPCKICGYSY